MAEKEVKVVVSGDASGAETALKKAGKAAADFGNSAEKAGNQVETNLDKANSSAQKAAKGIGSLNTAFEGLKAAAALGAIGSVVKGIASMGTEAIMASARMKQYEIAFTTMLKSAEKGKVMMQDLQDFAAKTPFDVPGVVEAAQQLTAFGFEAKDIIPTLTTLGDAAAGLGRGSEGVKLMGYALGQIKAAGTLKTQDVNQLVNAGVSVWQMLAEASGKSVAEIKDMTEKGMIDSLSAIEIITKGMQDNYGGMMAATGKEVVGLVNEISEGMGNGLALVGGFMTDSLGVKDILKSVAESVSSMSVAFKVAKDSGKSFGDALLAAVPAPVLVVIGALVSLIGAALVGAIGVAVAAIGTLLAPVAGTVAAVVAIGTGISALLATSETARNVLSAAFEAVKSVIDTVIDVINDLVNIFSDSSKTFGESYLEAVGYVAGLFYRLADNVWEAMGNALDSVIKFVSDSVDSFVDFITGGADMGDDFVDMMGNVAERAVTSIVDWFKGLPTKIEGIFNSIKAGFNVSANGTSLGLQGWMSSGSSDDYDLMNKDFNIYSGQRESASKKGTANLSGSGSATKAGSTNKGLDKVEREISRINEAIASAQDATDALQTKFSNLNLDIALEGTSGSERVFAQIDREKTARLQAIDEVLKSQINAVNEAQKLRESAEKTGDINAIANAQALYDERNALYQNSLNQAGAMRSEVEQQAYDKSLTLETQLQAAKAEAEKAMQEMSMENFIAYLDSKDAEQYARLQTEQEYRQQMFDWEMESQQSLLDFAIQAAETMKNQLASGIAAVITEGTSFGKMLANLGKQILNMFLQWVIGRALASAMSKLFAQKDSATLAAQAAKDTAALTPPAVLNESLHPGSIAKAALTVGAVAAVGSIAASSFGANDNSQSGYSIKNSIAGSMSYGSSIGSGVTSTNPFADSGNILSSGSGISVTNNNYGPINTGSDLDDLFSGFSGAVLSAVRGG